VSAEASSSKLAHPDGHRAHHAWIRAWLHHPYGSACVVFVAALAVRALHLHDVAIHDPFWTIPSVDGAFYDESARRLIAGEGLEEGVLYLGPLYPLFIAGVYSFVGESLPALKGVQGVLGAVSCVLVHAITRMLFGPGPALVAGLSAAFYGLFVFYCGTVMIVNVQVPLVLGIVLTALLGLRNPRFVTWGLCGLLVGLSALARQTTLLLAPALALWILFGMPGPYSFARRFAWGTTFGVAVCALILPFTVRNYVQGDDLVLLNSTGGYNFYMGNQKGADGTWQLPQIGWKVRVDNPRTMREAFTGVAQAKTRRPMKPSEVSAYWRALGMEEIWSDPIRWLRLELRKAALFINADEIWNNRSSEVSRGFSRVLRWPLIELSLIAPLGLLGLGLTTRRWRELFPLHAALSAYLASALLFFVLSRYRMPATLLLIPFAAFAAFDFTERLRSGKVRRLAAPLLALVLLIGLVQLPLVEENRMHMAWYNLGNKYRELGRWPEAVDAYQKSLEEQPSAISTYNNLALAYEDWGRREEAAEAWRAVRRIGRRIGSPRHIERAERHLKTLAVDAPASRAEDH
jgi:hypothetical protein